MNTPDITQIPTRKALREHLSEVGITGAAQEAILGETGHYRHDIRVRAAATAATVEVERTWGPLIAAEAEAMDDGIPSRQWTGHGWAADVKNLLGFLVCTLDAFGHGGPDGVSGAATGRIAAFGGLGSGRKQATDGEAWTAAIREAAIGFGGSLARIYAPEQPQEQAYLGVRNNECSYTVTISSLILAGLGPETLTLCREGLRLSLGLAPWFASHPTELDADCPTAWATCVNELTAAAAVETNGDVSPDEDVAVIS